MLHNDGPLTMTAAFSAGVLLPSDVLDHARNAAESWAIETQAAIQADAPSASNELKRSIKKYNRYKDGLPSSIGFKMVRHGVYIEKGAGRGYKGKNGTSWEYNKGKNVSKPNRFYKGKLLTNKRTTDPTAPHVMNTGKRVAQPYFNDNIEQRVNKLADAMAEVYLDIVVKNVFIK